MKQAHNTGAILGIELGSTRIKAVLMDESHQIIASGGSTWNSCYENGIWTYDLEQAWSGLRETLAQIWSHIHGNMPVLGAGVSAMMHGYLAFDENWNLLVPFRTWQNTNTREASEELTRLLNYNIPQRWSIAHLYHAVKNGEAHVGRVAHITTLAGYIHHALTGENVLCVDDASGMFPINPQGTDFDEGMLNTVQGLLDAYHLPWKLRQILPTVLGAGTFAGNLTGEGSALVCGFLPEGTPFAPPAGDGGTGMVATNSVAPKTGNVSAGTSIFADIVLERPLQNLHPEIDNVTTPTGKPVAEIHCNNCTADMNAWVAVFAEFAELFGMKIATNDLYEGLYRKSLEAEADAGGIITNNYLAGECITHLDKGIPMVLRPAESRFNLANLMRSQLYSTFATLRIGMDLLRQENVHIESIMAHGGVFKTPGVGQAYLAAAMGVAVTCMDMAGDGGPYGMALLTAYMLQRCPNETLEDYLMQRIFAKSKVITVSPNPEYVAGYEKYMKSFTDCLSLQQIACRLL